MRRGSLVGGCVLMLFLFAASDVQAVVICWFAPWLQPTRREYSIDPESWLTLNDAQQVPIAGGLRLREADPCALAQGNGWFATIERLAMSGGGLDLTSPPAAVTLGAATISPLEGAVGWSFLSQPGGLPVLYLGASAELDRWIEPIDEDDGRLRSIWFDRDPDGASSLEWLPTGFFPAHFDLALVILTASSLCHADPSGGYGCGQEAPPQAIGALRLVATVPEAGATGRGLLAFGTLVALHALSGSRERRRQQRGGRFSEPRRPR